MSCRPAVGMPNTRQYIVRRLDSQEQEVNLLKKATGGECLDKVNPKDLTHIHVSSYFRQIVVYSA